MIRKWLKVALAAIRYAEAEYAYVSACENLEAHGLKHTDENCVICHSTRLLRKQVIEERWVYFKLRKEIDA